MRESLYVVIMAGGGGTRFWPYSREACPKQFLDILGTGKSLLRNTFDRFEQVCPADHIYVVTHENYKGLIEEHLPDIPKENILLEPYRKNTAPCIAYAAYKLRQRNPKATMVVSPADHAIFHEKKFFDTLEKAVEGANQQEWLVTLGIRPFRPETGYGYIQFFSDTKGPVKKVKTFTEKPELDLAKKFIESGDFVWNSGMFIWKVENIIAAFESHLPEMAEVFQDGHGIYNSAAERDFIKKSYPICRSISIDYGIMEKAPNVYVVLGDFGWSDLGSWESIYDLRDKDKRGNAVETNALYIDSEDCMVNSSDGKLVVVEGQKNLLVTDCGDVLLISERGEGQKIKDIMSKVKSEVGTDFL